MNFIETLESVKLVLDTGEVPLIVGESGIGKTALAKQLAKEKGWSLIVIDGNLLKEGEIGGLPIVETYIYTDKDGVQIEKKRTVYAIHAKLREIEEELEKGKEVLLFIDEVNRCEHTVQQELMNLILNREINGYHLAAGIKILAAMNPSSKYGKELDYQVVDMDPAQENRFVWLSMESDHVGWLKWAMESGIEEKVIEFISTFPEYLNKRNDEDIHATPRSYERISKSYRIYKEQKQSISINTFLNVVRGNVGKVIAQEFVYFVKQDHIPLLTYDDIFLPEVLNEAVKAKVKNENHTRLYLTAINILKYLEKEMGEKGYEEDKKIDRLIAFLKIYPVDLMIGIMKEIKNGYPQVYQRAIENEAFVALYFETYKLIREE